MSLLNMVLDFFTRQEKASVGRGSHAVEKQIASGKLTARERITTFLDQGIFHEYDLFVNHTGRDFGMDKKELPVAAANGYIDALINPSETCENLIHALKISDNKKEFKPERKHGISPL